MVVVRALLHLCLIHVKGPTLHCTSVKWALYSPPLGDYLRIKGPSVQRMLHEFLPRVGVGGGGRGDYRTFVLFPNIGKP